MARDPDEFLHVECQESVRTKVRIPRTVYAVRDTDGILTDTAFPFGGHLVGLTRAYQAQFGQSFSWANFTKVHIELAICTLVVFLTEIQK